MLTVGAQQRSIKSEIGAQLTNMRVEWLLCVHDNTLPCGPHKTLPKYFNVTTDALSRATGAT